VVSAAEKDKKEDIKGHVEALLKGFRSGGKKKTACQISSDVCPENSKASPEEMEVEVVTCKELSGKIEDIDLGANTQATEAVVERQELRRRLAVRRRRWAKKWTQDRVGSRQKLFAAHKRLMHCAALAVHKGHVRKGPGRDSVGSETPK
jgi:hypothetical protein